MTHRQESLQIPDKFLKQLIRTLIDKVFKSIMVPESVRLAEAMPQCIPEVYFLRAVPKGRTHHDMHGRSRGPTLSLVGDKSLGTRESGIALSSTMPRFWPKEISEEIWRA